jgi:VanZ family protein
MMVCESTDTFSSAKTSQPLRQLWVLLSGPVSDQAWLVIHHHIRKTGHAVGYGLLSGLFFRAWFLTIRLFSERRAQVWQVSAVLALACTLVVGSRDEFHQRFIPSRSSSPLDVAVDMAGAITVQLLIAMCFLARSRQRAPVAIESTTEF